MPQRWSILEGTTRVNISDGPFFEIKIITAVFISLVWWCGILFPLIVRGGYLNVVWGAHLYFSSLFFLVNESVSIYVKPELFLLTTYTHLNFHDINPVASRNSNLEFWTHLRDTCTRVFGNEVITQFFYIHLSYSLTASQYHPFSPTGHFRHEERLLFLLNIFECKCLFPPFHPLIKGQLGLHTGRVKQPQD